MAVRNMKNAGVRIIVLIVVNADAARDVLAEASLQGLAGPNFVFVGSDAAMDLSIMKTGTNVTNFTNEYMSRVDKAVQGMIGIVPYLQSSGPAYEEFMELWKSTPNITNE